MFYGIYGDSNGDTPEVIGEASWLLARTCFPGENLNGNVGHSKADVTCKLTFFLLEFALLTKIRYCIHRKRLCSPVECLEQELYHRLHYTALERRYACYFSREKSWTFVQWKLDKTD